MHVHSTAHVKSLPTYNMSSASKIWGDDSAHMYMYTACLPNILSRILCSMHLDFALTNVSWPSAWEIMSCTCAAESLTPLKSSRWRPRQGRRNMASKWRGRTYIAILVAILHCKSVHLHYKLVCVLVQEMYTCPHIYMYCVQGLSSILGDGIWTHNTQLFRHALTN